MPGDRHPYRDLFFRVVGLAPRAARRSHRRIPIVPDLCTGRIVQGQIPRNLTPPGKLRAAKANSDTAAARPPMPLSSVNSKVHHQGPGKQHQSPRRKPGVKRGQIPPNATLFTSTKRPPLAFRPTRVRHEKQTHPHGKRPLCDGVCQWTAHHPQAKPLKTKTLEVGVNTRCPNRAVFSRDRVKICKILQFRKENLYPNRQRLLFQSLQRTRTWAPRRKRNVH